MNYTNVCKNAVYSALTKPSYNIANTRGIFPAKRLGMAL